MKKEEILELGFISQGTGGDFYYHKDIKVDSTEDTTMSTITTGEGIYVIFQISNNVKLDYLLTCIYKVGLEAGSKSKSRMIRSLLQV